MTWDEVVEIAARAQQSKRNGSPDWDWLSARAKARRLRETDAALRALIAEGLAIVPREVTPAIEDAHFEAHAAAKTLFAEMPDLWRAMLSAGEIKPEDPSP